MTDALLPGPRGGVNPRRQKAQLLVSLTRDLAALVPELLGDELTLVLSNVDRFDALQELPLVIRALQAQEEALAAEAPPAAD